MKRFVTVGLSVAAMLLASVPLAQPAAAETFVGIGQTVTVPLGSTVTSLNCFTGTVDNPNDDSPSVYPIGRLKVLWNGQDAQFVAEKNNPNQLHSRCSDPAYPVGVTLMWTPTKVGTFTLEYCVSIAGGREIFVGCVPSGTVIVAAATTPAPATTPNTTMSGVKEIKCLNKVTYKKRTFYDRSKCPKGWIKI
jgi:hypothetical protein